MKNERDYYKLLHVQPDAPTEIIRSSYRTLMLKLKQHPDLGGDAWNASLINEAYEILTDSEKRAKYDQDMLQSNRAKEGKSPETIQPQEANRKNGYARYKGFNPSHSSFCAFCKTPHNGEPHQGTDQLCCHCKSPLNPAVKISLETEQKRAVKRMARHDKITFYTDWPQHGHHGHIHDLSPLGMRILTEQSLQKGQVIKIENAILHATARVVSCRCKHGGQLPMYAIGIEFLTLCFQQSLGSFVSVTA